MNEPIISARHLTYRYPTSTSYRPALADVTFEIASGSSVAIVGSNGSGKSTLIQHFNGLLQPTAGTVIVDGTDVGCKGTNLQPLRERVGILFQSAESQLFEATVYDDVAFAPRRLHLDRREVRRRVQAALTTVGLPPHEFARRAPFDLSGGQRRRVALAGILAMNPSILILDEPTAGLDGSNREELYRYLRRMRHERNITLILVSHDMAEVAALSEHVIVLHQGQLVMQASPGYVFSQQSLLQQWGLAVPPLSDLLMRLRVHGMPVPEEIVTLDQAQTYLLTRLP